MAYKIIIYSQARFGNETAASFGQKTKGSGIFAIKI